MIVEDPTRERVAIADVGGGIEIAYESFGDPSDPTMLLVMGLGMQMLAWDERFCAACSSTAASASSASTIATSASRRRWAAGLRT